MITRRTVLFSLLLVCASIHPTLAQLTVTKSTVDGSFPGAYWIYAYDINADGEIDLVSGSGSAGVRWYQNNNNKTFSRKTIDNNFFGIWTVTAFDIDGDGDGDVVASSTALDIVAWWQNQNNSSFVKQVVDSISLDPESNFATDLDGDGDGDIIVGGWESDELVWCENLGGGIFERRVLDSSFNNVHSVYAAKLDNNGSVDILGGGAGKSLFWLNNGNGSFTKRTLDNEGAWSVFPKDIDGDGDIDIVRSHRNNRDIDWFRNNGNGTFSSSINIDTQFAPRMSPSPDSTEIWSVAAGDVDGDSDTDVVAAIYPKDHPNTDGYVYAWLNDGSENFTEFVVDSLVKGPRSVAVADFDEDGDQDIAAATNSGVVWYEILGGSGGVSITLIQPNGGETIPSASTFPIQWTSSGTINNVKLEYSIDVGVIWNTIIASTPNTGSFTWSVPDVQTSSALVRISDAADGIPFDLSNSAFTIGTAGPSITLFTPNGGESLIADSTAAITWTSTGAIANVKLDYSLNNGASWINIRSSTPNDGAAGWTVPAVESNTALVRVSDASNSAIFDVSDAVFTISSSSIKLLSPNGGESWAGGSTQQITWTSAGSISFVKLEYSLDTGANWTAIIASSENDGTYAWSVPAISSSTALVRISDASDGIPIDVSDAVFAIVVPQAITLLSPNGGENWAGNSTQIITWNTGGSIPFVKLEYSINNGSSWTNIVTGLTNSGNFFWTVPDVQTNTALVRVSDIDGTPFDVSNGVFSISGASLTLTAPNGGETWTGGSSQTITWTSGGAIANVKLEYSTNNGSSWTTIVSSTANDGSHTWSVPDVQTSSALVRVSDAADDLPTDVSNSTFTITGSSLTLTAPNGGETWAGGSSQNIIWSSSGSITNVKLEYSTNNGASWTIIISSTANDGSHTWSVPDVQTSSALVRVSDAADDLPSDVSNSTFTITGASLTLTAPNGGETWAGGGSQTITWSSSGSIANVKLEYSTNNGNLWTTIISSTANDGSHIWSVPIVQTSSALLRVSDASDGIPSDVSDAVFSISSAATLTLISPNGGESWIAGGTQQIIWSSTGSISAVKIEYSTNNGGSWTTIDLNTPNDGVYEWIIPAVETNTALVRVSDVSNSAIFDVSDQVFTIATPVEDTVTVTSPNGGESWTAGSTRAITWVSTGNIQSLKLEYSVNSGTTWTTIAASAANTGSYSWTVPNTGTNSALIRISDASDGSPSDVSNNVFTIVPENLTLTAPNGGESWVSGTSRTITWISTGTIVAVKLEYSLNNGRNWTTISSSAANSGSYNWTIPAVPSDSARVRVSDAIDGSPSDISDGVFAISGPLLQLVSPNGGEILQSELNVFIVWTSSGISAVKLEYSLNMGGSWTTITSNTVNVGSYIWTVPKVESDSAMVRISNANNGGNPFDTSDQVFTITADPVGVEDPPDLIPNDFELSQNYPNPFNPQTKIDFAVPKSAEVHLAIYNLKGELIRTLHAGQFSPGRYTAVWDGRNHAGEPASSGVYIYKIRIGEWQATKKLTLIK